MPLQAKRAQSLARQVVLASRSISRIVLEKVKIENFQFNLTYAAILPAIDLEGTRLTEIARRTGLTKQGLFPYISELESLGFITKVEDPKDKRANLIMFSAKGRALLEQVHHALSEAEQMAQEVLGPQHAVTVREGLAKLNEVLVAQTDLKSHPTQTALPSSADLFSSAFTHAAIGMALVGLDGRWLDVNNSMCEIVGYTRPELLKLTFQDVTHPDDLDADLEFAKHLLEGRISSYHLEKRYIKKNGETVWILLTGTLVRHADGSPYHFIAQVQDITDRRQDNA
ncbi:PAS domain S-box-containing protein [Paucimonas lemoignei]|uniref:histidine kinase n=1 Tax=Paucimonas lemoignei TaxID=29443 RepID=A0A4V2UIX2_PAULE|nr:PAS domain S-box-containing protein [Paucimonas lemoignei]